MGFEIIGGVALGALGITGASVAATITAGVITSAVVGAAIGGLSAAVMGGDIGSGLLFGAIGGVVTGGLAGGAIVEGLGLGAVSTEAMAMEAAMGIGEGIGATMGAAVVPGAAPITGAVTAGIGAAEAGSLVAAGGLFGGSMNIGKLLNVSNVGDKLLDFAIGGLKEDPEVPYSQTKEYLDRQLEAEEEALEKRIASAEKQIGLTGEERRKDIELQNIAALEQLRERGDISMREVEKTYELRKEELGEQYALEAEKYRKAATAASGVEFKAPETGMLTGAA